MKGKNITYKDITERRNTWFTELSAMVNGYRVSRMYNGYTRREMYKLFYDYCNSL